MSYRPEKALSGRYRSGLVDILFRFLVRSLGRAVLCVSLSPVVLFSSFCCCVS